MAHLQSLIRFTLFLLIWTAIGQIRWNQRSIEDRYHTVVNSRSFQTLFWTAARPITWTSEKLQDLWEESPTLNKIPAR